MRKLWSRIKSNHNQQRVICSGLALILTIASVVPQQTKGIQATTNLAITQIEQATDVTIENDTTISSVVTPLSDQELEVNLTIKGEMTETLNDSSYVFIMDQSSMWLRENQAIYEQAKESFLQVIDEAQSSNVQISDYYYNVTAEELATDSNEQYFDTFSSCLEYIVQNHSNDVHLILVGEPHEFFDVIEQFSNDELKTYLINDNKLLDDVEEMSEEAVAVTEEALYSSYELQGTNQLSEVFLHIIEKSKQQILLERAELNYVLNDAFEFVEDTVTVLGLDSTEQAQGMLSENRDELTLSLGRLEQEETRVTFKVKVKDFVTSSGVFDLTKSAILNYQSRETNESLQVRLGNATVSLEEVPNSQAETDEVIIDDSMSLDASMQSSGQYTVNKTVTPASIEQGAETQVVLTIKGQTDVKKTYENTNNSFFSYSGTWTNKSYNTATYPNRTDDRFHFSDKGGSISFTFTGTGFEWYVGMSHAGDGYSGQIGYVNIETKDASNKVVVTEEVKWNESSLESRAIYKLGNLPHGTYTVKITVKEIANQTLEYKYGKIYSDKVIVENTKFVDVTDFIDTNKFELVPGNYKAMSGTDEVGSLIVDESNQMNDKVVWDNVYIGEKDTVISYKIKAKDNAATGQTTVHLATQDARVVDVETKVVSAFNNPLITILKQTKLNLETNKTASVNDDGTYTITLEVKSTTTIEHQKADIVLVMDISGSMGQPAGNDKLSKVKTAANTFVSELLDSAQFADQIQISLVSFNSIWPIPNPPQGAASYVNATFTNDKTTLQTAINALNADRATNTQDGIWRAQDMLNHARSDASKYVIFFTDGAPTQMHAGGGGTETGYEKYFMAAQEEYYKYFTGYGNPSKVTIGGLGGIMDGQTRPAYTLTLNSNVKYQNVRFYAVGLFTNDSQTAAIEKELGPKFLKTIQNVVNPEKYEEHYFAEDANSVSEIFKNIKNDIADRVGTLIAKDTVIHDIVTPQFGIISNSWNITDLEDNKIDISNENIILSKTSTGEDEITFKVGDIIANQTTLIGGIRVSFKVKVKDDYYSNPEIATNVSADVTFKEPTSGKENEQEFNVPTVTIDPKKGSVTITKEIVRQAVDGSYVPVSSSEVNQKDRFSISLRGEQIYTVDLIGNETQTMNFYLKGEETDISTNTDTSLNYFTIGEYTVSELLPMNYEQVGVYIKDSHGEWIPLEGAISIDKDQPHVEIKVCNRIINDLYWQDKSDVINELLYQPISQ